MNAPHSYRAFGLNVLSELEMPHWPAAGGAIDVHVRWGDVPDALPGYPQLWGGAFAGRGGRCLLSYRGVGRMMVEDGRRITCSTEDGGSAATLGTSVSSVGFAALLSQRGRLCLHASAAEKDGRAFLVSGPSGAGKSTIVSALLERGCRLLSDDITVIDIRADGSLEAIPSFPAIRLRPDSLSVIGLRGTGRERVDGLDDKVRQRFDDRFVGQPVRIARICRVVTGSVTSPICEPVTGVHKFPALQRVVFRPHMARLLTDARALDHAVMTVASRVEFRRIVRPETGFHLDAICRSIAG